LGLNWTKLTKIGTELNISHETLTCSNDTKLTHGNDTGLTRGSNIAKCYNGDLTCRQHF